MECGGATVFLTDGRTATRRARDNGIANTVLLDLALDYAGAKRVALTRADQCSDAAYHAVVGVFQAAGFAVSSIGDVPGMAVDAHRRHARQRGRRRGQPGRVRARAVDTAMQKGVNYPRGPLAWADAIGIDYLMTVLANLCRGVWRRPLPHLPADPAQSSHRSKIP